MQIRCRAKCENGCTFCDGTGWEILGWGGRRLDSMNLRERIKVMEKCGDSVVYANIKAACALLNSQAPSQEWIDLVKREYCKGVGKGKGLGNLKLSVLLRKGVRRYARESGVPEARIKEIADRYDILS